MGAIEQLDPTPYAPGVFSPAQAALLKPELHEHYFRPLHERIGAELETLYERQGTPSSFTQLADRAYAAGHLAYQTAWSLLGEDRELLRWLTIHADAIHLKADTGGHPYPRTPESMRLALADKAQRNGLLGDGRTFLGLTSFDGYIKAATPDIYSNRRAILHNSLGSLMQIAGLADNQEDALVSRITKRAHDVVLDNYGNVTASLLGRWAIERRFMDMRAQGAQAYVTVPLSEELHGPAVTARMGCPMMHAKPEDSRTSYLRRRLEKLTEYYLAVVRV
jgi:hypothetical protein